MSASNTAGGRNRRTDPLPLFSNSDTLKKALEEQLWVLGNREKPTVLLPICYWLQNTLIKPAAYNCGWRPRLAAISASNALAMTAFDRFC